MDSKVVFKKTARLAVTAGLAVSMTLGSFPVAVFADAAADPALKPAAEQEAPKAETAPTEEQEAPKAEEKATEGEETPEAEPVAEGASAPGAQTAADEPAAKTWQQKINDAQEGDTITLSGTITENLTVDKKLTITAAEGTVVKGNLTINSGANGTVVSGVHFVQDDTTTARNESIVLNSAPNVTIKGCTFDISQNADHTKELTGIRAKGSSNGLKIGDNQQGNTFNIATHKKYKKDDGKTITSETWSGVNLIGGTLSDVTIQHNTLNGLDGQRSDDITTDVNGDGKVDVIDKVGSIGLVVANGNHYGDSQGYGITKLEVINNYVYNKTSQSGEYSRLYGLMCTNADDVTVRGNHFEGYAALSWSVWKNDKGQYQTPSGDVTVSDNGIDTSVGFIFSKESIGEGKLTVGPKQFTDNVAVKYKGTAVHAQTESGKVYSSISEALKDRDAATVTLLQSTTEDVVIPVGKTVTLDLAGHTLTNDKNHTITNNGTLTVKDSVGGGVVDNVSNSKGALENIGTATIEGGTFTRSKEASTSTTDGGGNTWYVVDNNGGTLTVNNGVVKNNSKMSSLVRNLNGTMTVNGGEFSNDFNTLKNDSNGKLIITGGTVTSGNQAVQNWSDAAIEGGTFNGKVTTFAWTDPKTGAVDAGSTTISGGTINGDVTTNKYNDSATVASVTISGGKINGQVNKMERNSDGKYDAVDPASDTSKIVISGGEFSKDRKPAQEFLDPSVGFGTDSEGNLVVKEPELQLKSAQVTYDVVKGELTDEQAVMLVGAYVDVDAEDYQVATVAKSLEALNAAIKAGKTGDYELQFMAAKKGAKAKAADAQFLKTATVTLTDSTPAPEPEPVEKFTVTFVDNFNKTSAEVSVEKGEAVVKPADPSFEGWKFEGWFTDKAAKNAYDFSTPVTGDLTLYAGYSKAGVATETEPEQTEAQKPADKGALPKTGDDSVLPMAVAAGAGVVAVAVGAVVLKHRKQE